MSNLKYALFFISGVVAGSRYCNRKIIKHFGKRGSLNDLLGDAHLNISSLLNRLAHPYSDFETSPYSIIRNFNGVTICFKYRSDAEKMKQEFEDIIFKYNFLSVSDLYEYVNKDPLYSYSDNRYGWTDYKIFTIFKCKNGYEMRLPLPENVF